MNEISDTDGNKSEGRKDREARKKDSIRIYGMDEFTKELEKKQETGKAIICLIDGPSGGGKSTFSRFLTDYIHNRPDFDKFGKGPIEIPILDKKKVPSPDELLKRGVMGIDQWLDPRDSPIRKNLKMTHFQWYRFEEFDKWLKETDFSKDKIPLSFNMYDNGITRPVDIQIPFTNKILIIEGVYSLLMAGHHKYNQEAIKLLSQGDRRIFETISWEMLERDDVDTLNIIIGNLETLHEQRFIKRGVTDRGYTEKESKKQFTEKVVPQWQEYWGKVSKYLGAGLSIELQAISGDGFINISKIPE